MLAVAVAGLLLLAAIVGVVAHFRTPGRAWLLGISAFSPYLMLAAPAAVIVLALSRQWVALLVAVAVTVICVATQVPLYTSATAPAGSVELATMTANLRLGEASATDVVAAVRQHHVDVLMLQELTPEEQQRLAAAGLDRALPFHASDPRPFALGTGLWSRYPMRQEQLRHDFTCAFVTASVQVPGLTHEPTLAALHMPGPWPNSGRWQLDINHLPTVLAKLALTGTVVVGGDFNSTTDVAQFRAATTDGYEDAASQTGAGMTRTYPSDRWFPPLIAIDHILTRRAVATRAETVEISGSDHRALLVNVAISNHL